MARNSVLVRILGDASSFERSTKKAATATQKLNKKFSMLGAGFAAREVFQFGKAAVRAAQDEERASALLAQTLKQSAGARAEDIESVEKWIAATQASVAVADDELRPALAALVTATGDTAKAQDLMALAMDVSAATGKPLLAVARDLGKAHNGSVAGLKKYGIATKDADGKVIEFTKAQDLLAAKMGGSAAAAADTSAGKMKALGLKFEEIQEQLGAALIPILSDLGEILLKVANFVERNIDVIAPLALAIGGLAVAIKIATIAQKLWNLAMEENPVGLIVLAIGALVAALVVAYKKVGWFRTGVDAMWQGLQRAADTAVAAFRAAFNAIASMWNATIGKIKISIPKVFGFGGFTLDVPDIPTISAPRSTAPVNVTVNVAGHIMAERDFEETVRRSLIKAKQRGFAIA